MRAGYIARRSAGSGERWSLFWADGSLSNSFAVDQDREAVKVLLARGGFTLRDDNIVEGG